MSKFGKWLLDPFVEFMLPIISSKVDNIEDINEELIDKVYEEPYQLPKKDEHGKVASIFRPNTLKEYIGQIRAKRLIVDYISEIYKRNKVFPHTLLIGSAGIGKTTLAKIIANTLNIRFIECITASLGDSNILFKKIAEVDGGILFLDEIHSLNRNTAELLYPIMEDFKYNGSDIKPFTLMGATTEVGMITKDKKPFFDRFLVVELENYSLLDIERIIRQYKKVIFPTDELTNATINLIARNSRLNPRSAIRLLEATIYAKKDIRRAMFNLGILKDGITLKDYRILKYISQNINGVGLIGIANYVGTGVDNYTYYIEPYLIQRDLIVKTPRGRKITNEGLNLIKEIEQGEKGG